MTGAGRGLDVPCSAIVEMITDYIEDAFPHDQRRVIEEHLADCPPCKRYVDQIRTTIVLLGTVPDDTLSEEAWHELQAAFRVG